VLRKLILTLLIASTAMVLSLQARAGSSQNELNCRSSDGSLSMIGAVPPDGNDEIDVVISNKSKTFHMVSTNANPIRTVRAVSDLLVGVFILEASAEQEGKHLDAFFTLYAIHRTVVTRKIRNGLESTWEGRLLLGGQAVTTEYEPRRTVRCSTRYAV
jgi:hypothetical protein